MWVWSWFGCTCSDIGAVERGKMASQSGASRRSISVVDEESLGIRGASKINFVFPTFVCSFLSSFLFTLSLYLWLLAVHICRRCINLFLCSSGQINRFVQTFFKFSNSLYLTVFLRTGILLSCIFLLISSAHFFSLFKVLNVILTEKLPCAGTCNNLKFWSRNYCCGLRFSEQLFGVMWCHDCKTGYFHSVLRQTSVALLSLAWLAEWLVYNNVDIRLGLW